MYSFIGVSMYLKKWLLLVLIVISMSIVGCSGGVTPLQIQR